MRDVTNVTRYVTAVRRDEASRHRLCCVYFTVFNIQTTVSFGRPHTAMKDNRIDALFTEVIEYDLCPPRRERRHGHGTTRTRESLTVRGIDHIVDNYGLGSFKKGSWPCR